MAAPPDTVRGVQGVANRARALLIGVALGATLSGGCGDDEEAAPTTKPAEERAQATEPAAEPEQQVELYFTSGEQFRKAGREIEADGEEELVAVAEELVEGPTRPERRAKVEAQTQIPPATEVEDVSLDDGVATVEVSEAFVAGIPDDPSQRSPGEELDLNARLAQMTFTLTQFERVDETRVVVGGEPVETRLSRSDYVEPERGPVRVERPRGERSKSTRKVQKRLAALRYLPKSAVDGVAGYRTQQAVLAFQSWEGLERDGIVGPATTAALGRAQRPEPRAGGPSRRVEVFRAEGVALLVKRGRTKRAIHVSTGAPGYETPSGTYEVFRKELKSWSVPYSVWLPYASYFNNGIAFHEYADVPVFPASHGCVRVPTPEAQIVYRFASVGTTVVVH